MEPNAPQPSPDPPSESSSTPPSDAGPRAGRYFLLTLFVLALVAFIWVIKIFLLHIVVAAVFATLFYPLQRRLAGWLKGRQGLAAAFSTLVILLALLIPISFVMNLVIRQAIDVYHTFQPKVQQVLQEGDAGPLGELKKVKILGVVDLSKVDWNELVSSTAKFIGSLAPKIVNRTTQMTFGVIVDLFVVLFTIFYFLRDGRQILGRIQNLLPLSDTNKQLLASRFAAISRATVKGTLVIALIQGTLGGLTLLIFGFDNWLLWGVVMVVLAALPMVGTGLILIPSGIYRIVSGDVWQGVAVILVSVLVVSTIDNFLRPRLVGRDVQMHDLLILFSTIGGITVFGIMGFIIGPMVVALFLTILDIFSLEYMNRAAPVPPTA
ncbi:MAG TPA: AI-2E family transporter [Acidobacteriota bacterium]|nr:AI-2E family transporter [Acidobacteriota bacterium]HQM65042.1 AI-2E family transporter [Acidobacteriota bacterium]